MFQDAFRDMARKGYLLVSEVDVKKYFETFRVLLAHLYN